MPDDMPVPLETPLPDPPARTTVAPDVTEAPIPAGPVTGPDTKMAAEDERDPITRELDELFGP